MKNILILVPKCSGPSKEKKWNSTWPADLEEKIDKLLWKVFTPGVLVIANLTDRTKYYIDLVDEMFNEVDADKHYDIVAMYTVTPNVKRAYMWADFYKSKGTYVVLGGVHSSVCPDEAERYADTLLIGEAENIWVEFLKDYELKETKKIYSQPIGVIDVTKSPIPAFDMLPQNARKIIPIQTARGCPHGCKFCNLRSIYGNGYRPKTAEAIVHELKAALTANPRAIIYFTDDNFFCYQERAKEVLESIRELKITWYANTDIQFGLSQELVEAAYESGCRSVLIGLESINPESLKGIDQNNFKNSNCMKYQEVIKTIQSTGIGVIGSFIIGLDYDNKDIFDKLACFIQENALYGANITVNTPYPGTILFRQMNDEGRIKTFDWNYYTIFEPVIEPRNMSVEELNIGYQKLLSRIYEHNNVMERINAFKNQMRHSSKPCVRATDMSNN